MARGKDKKDSNVSIAIVVAIVLIASVLLILRPIPEQVVALSEDGLVRVEGVTRSASALHIERLNAIETSIEGLASPVYEISLDVDGRLDDAEMVMSFGELPQDTLLIQDAAIYQFNRTTLAWETVPTLFDLDRQTLSAALELSGSVMVGVGERVQDE